MGNIVGFFVVWSIGSFVAAPAMQLILKGIGMSMSAMGLGLGVLACNVFIFITALMVAIGDPIVLALNKGFPELFGVSDFKAFNLRTAIFVLNG